LARLRYVSETCPPVGQGTGLPSASKVPWLSLPGCVQGTGLPSLTSTFGLAVVGWLADSLAFGSPSASSAIASEHDIVILISVLLSFLLELPLFAASGQDTQGGEGKYGFFVLVPYSENHVFWGDKSSPERERKNWRSAETLRSKFSLGNRFLDFRYVLLLGCKLLCYFFFYLLSVESIVFRSSQQNIIHIFARH
jgi:hypothetical protein